MSRFVTPFGRNKTRTHGEGLRPGCEIAQNRIFTPKYAILSHYFFRIIYKQLRRLYNSQYISHTFVNINNLIFRIIYKQLRRLYNSQYISHTFVNINKLIFRSV